MGIKNLMKILTEKSVKEKSIKSYTGKIIAFDASIQLYQFFIMISTKNEHGNSVGLSTTNANGETINTSHIVGFLNRILNLLENGIKPVFVFDGKPPSLKKQTLIKRSEIKKSAEKKIKELIEKRDSDNNENCSENNSIDVDDTEEINKLSKRVVHITEKDILLVKRLLSLMGIPFIDAPSEAEAQCSELCKQKKVYAVGTEDMDALTFGTDILIRKLTFSNYFKKMTKREKETVQELSLKNVLKDLDLTYEQFVDLCILCGCDYSNSIKGIGPVNALKMIKKHGNIESVIESIIENDASKKFKGVEEMKSIDHLKNNLDAIRKLFFEPDVIPGKDISLKFEKPDIEKLSHFLEVEMGFSKEKVESSMKRLEISSKIATQKSIEQFFMKKI